MFKYLHRKFDEYVDNRIVDHLKSYPTYREIARLADNITKNLVLAYLTFVDLHLLGLEQLLSEKGIIISRFLSALLLVKALGGVPSFGARVLFVTQLGLFARIVADIPYWNWYDFPLDYTISTIYDEVIGFFLVGLVLAWRLKPGVSLEQGAQA